MILPLNKIMYFSNQSEIFCNKIKLNNKIKYFTNKNNKNIHSAIFILNLRLY